MFRLDGEVFLFGTAIAAPLKSIKIARICASSQRDRPTGGSWIVANRRSYSGWGRGCKSGRKRGVTDEWIGRALVAEGGHGPVPRNEGGVVAHRPQPGRDRADQLLL